MLVSKCPLSFFEAVLNQKGIKSFIFCTVGFADVIASDDPEEAFKDADACFLVGAMPRKAGMERSDLLAANVKIFKAQGQAMDKHAKKTCKVIVWTSMQENLSSEVCEQHRRRPACATTQSHQRLCHSGFGKYHM